MTLQPQSLNAQFLKNVQLNYLLYLPDEYEKANEPLPMILYLHGRGERGSDLKLVKKHGIAKRLAAGDQFPFIILAPQCPLPSDWSVQLDALDALVDYALTTYRVDPARLYLTGLSMGGRGAWSLAFMRPHRFAAIAPICARRPDILRDAHQMMELKHLPAWIFHGAKDDTVPVEESELMMKQLQECGADARLTIYPDAKHDSWTQAYNTPELYEWFLSHKL